MSRDRGRAHSGLSRSKFDFLIFGKGKCACRNALQSRPQNRKRKEKNGSKIMRTKTDSFRWEMTQMYCRCVCVGVCVPVCWGIRQKVGRKAIEGRANFRSSRGKKQNWFLRSCVSPSSWSRSLAEKKRNNSWRADSHAN